MEELMMSMSLKVSGNIDLFIAQLSKVLKTLDTSNLTIKGTIAISEITPGATGVKQVLIEMDQDQTPLNA